MTNIAKKRSFFFRREFCGVIIPSFTLCGLLAILIVLSLVPPVSKDALTHHLAVPSLYLKKGMIYEIPSMPSSYYPMNLELLYLIPLYFGNDIIPKFIHLSFALLTAWLIFSYLRKRANISYALFGVIFFLSIPIVVKLSTTAYVDLGLIFFTTSALLLLIRWIEKDFRLSYLVLSAIACGLAAGTKYNGLITLFVTTLFVPFIYSTCRTGARAEWKRPLWYAILFFFTAFFFFSPWLVRNFVWTNNPIYPLYDQWFNPKGDSANSVGVFVYRALVYKENWWEILLLPLRIFFQGRDGNPQFFDGKLNPFLLFFPIVAFIQLRKDEKKIKVEKTIMLAFSVLFFSFAFFSTGLRVRYISPIIPPLVILSVFGIKRLFETGDKSLFPCSKFLRKSTAVLCLIAALGLNAKYVGRQFDYVRPFSYITGKIDRDAYIEKFRPDYPVLKYVNNHLPPNARILFVFMGNSGYYCERSYLFDMENNKSRLETLIATSSDIKHIWRALKSDEVTHLLINMNIFKRWAPLSFRAEKMELAKSFFRNCLKLVYSKKGYSVFRLKQELNNVPG